MIPPHLACPECRQLLSAALECDRCERSFSRLNCSGKEIPVLYHSRTRTYPEEATISTPQNWFGKLTRRIPEPCLARFLNDDFFKSLEREGPDAWVLNLGAGSGQLHPAQPAGLRYVHLDLVPHPGLDVIADAHHLPFPDESFDAVFSNSALEHVIKPWVVAEEMTRVLKPGGRIYVQLPFLVPIHHEFDFWRFTDRGIQSLFDGLTPVDQGVSGGPTCALAQFLYEYIRLWAPSRGWLGKATRRFSSVALYPLLWLDRLLIHHPQLRLVANSFYFVARKP